MAVNGYWYTQNIWFKSRLNSVSCKKKTREKRKKRKKKENKRKRKKEKKEERQ